MTFNSRRPLPSTGITRIILWIFHGSRLVVINELVCTFHNNFTHMHVVCQY